MNSALRHVAQDDVQPGVERTPEGYVRFWMRLASPQIYEGYTFGSAEVSADTLRDPVALASLIGQPITIDHPDDFVGPESMRALRHGVVLSAEVVGAEPYAYVQLDTAEAIALAESRGYRLTCSPGYTFTPAPSSVADVAQTERRYNHVAILRAQTARGGPRCCAILTAHDGVPMDLTPEMLAEFGVPADKIEAAMAQLAPIFQAAKAAMEASEAADMGGEKVAAKVADAVRKATASRDAQIAQINREIASLRARAEDAEKRATDAEILVCGPLVRRAAAEVKVGDGANVVAIAEQAAPLLDLGALKGLDAVRRVADVGRGMARAAGPDNRWKGTAVAKDAEPQTSKTTPSLEM